METRSLIIQVPKPDEDGRCNRACELYDDDYDACFMDHEINEYPSQYSKPGPGCPWHEGGKDE